MSKFADAFRRIELVLTGVAEMVFVFARTRNTCVNPSHHTVTKKYKYMENKYERYNPVASLLTVPLSPALSMWVPYPAQPRAG